jgi:hypothetical protein
MWANMKLLAHAMNTMAAWLTLNAAQRAALQAQQGDYRDSSSAHTASL